MEMQRIGIVGGGQLALMLGEAAKRLGFHVTVLDPTPNAPASAAVDAEIVGDFKDEKKIRELAAACDVLTFEVEFTNPTVLGEIMNEGKKVHPSPATLGIIKDKFIQKQFLAKAGIPVAEFMAVDSADDAKRAGEAFGYPFILKGRLDSYDGRGNAVVHSEGEISSALSKLSGKGFYAEKFVPFIKELSVIAVRNEAGEVRTYPVVETIQKNNICHEVLAPAPVSDAAKSAAEALAMNVLTALDGVGVFGIEMFLAPGDAVLVNEIAPRVHNSGHFSIEGSATSQFENHIRAVAGMPLGDTAMKHPAAVMVNILGDRSGPAAPHGVEEAQKIPGVAVHIYGKHETRPERKMGHVTAVGASLEEARRNAEIARNLITI